jgi:hypothetical protein
MSARPLLELREHRPRKALAAGGLMIRMYCSIRIVFLFIAVGVGAGCGQQRSSLEGVQTAGAGEVWVVVEETQGEKTFGYVVHHCTPTGCKAVDTLERVNKDE